jgi:hypothetical protein
MVAVDDDVIAYRTVDLFSSTYHLVVRSRDTFDVLWTAPIQPPALNVSDPVLIAGGRVYLRDGTSNAPVVSAYDVDGCGAATCAPVMTAPVPPPASAVDSLDAQLLAVTDDGDVLLRRSWSTSRGVDFGNDLVALTSAGALDWALSMSQLDGVATAGDTVFAVGVDRATPSGPSTLFARSDSSTWRADVAVFGTPMAAGGLVYAEGGTGVRAFAADGCGAAICSEVAQIDDGPGLGSLYGMSVTAGTLFVNKAGPGGQLIAFRPLRAQKARRSQKRRRTSDSMPRSAS